MGQVNEKRRRKTEMNIRFVKNEAGANLQQLMDYAAQLTGIGDDL